MSTEEIIINWQSFVRIQPFFSLYIYKEVLSLSHQPDRPSYPSPTEQRKTIVVVIPSSIPNLRRCARHLSPKLPEKPRSINQIRSDPIRDQPTLLISSFSPHPSITLSTTPLSPPPHTYKMEAPLSSPCPAGSSHAQHPYSASSSSSSPSSTHQSTGPTSSSSSQEASSSFAPPPPPQQQHSADATLPFLRDFNLVAEAAKRAQMAVLLRDLEAVGL